MSYRERYNTCRFCKSQMTYSDNLIKYGTRHYAHPQCYLDAGKSPEDLPEYQRKKLERHIEETKKPYDYAADDLAFDAAREDRIFGRR